jgi:hypothetical protein
MVGDLFATSDAFHPRPGRAFRPDTTAGVLFALNL